MLVVSFAADSSSSPQSVVVPTAWCMSRSESARPELSLNTRRIKPVSQPASPIEHAATRDSGGPEQLDRLRNLDLVDNADRQPNLLSQPFRKRLRGRFGAAVEDHAQEVKLGWLRDWSASGHCLRVLRIKLIARSIRRRHDQPRAVIHAAAPAACATMSITASRSRISETRPSPRMLAPESPGIA